MQVKLQYVGCYDQNRRNFSTFNEISDIRCICYRIKSHKMPCKTYRLKVALPEKLVRCISWLLLYMFIILGCLVGLFLLLTNVHILWSFWWILPRCIIRRQWLETTWFNSHTWRKLNTYTGFVHMIRHEKVSLTHSIRIFPLFNTLPALFVFIRLLKVLLDVIKWMLLTTTQNEFHQTLSK